uniref:C-type lectin domain-containing protein n=1 Tax=Parascaris equorum TaxID=6256 RepID=A0A914S0C7_PAREQ
MLPLLVVFSLMACITACPGNGLYSGIFKNCYYFFPEAVDFFTAEMECQKMGGHLASANNDEEARMIAEYAVNVFAASNEVREFWLGGYDFDNSGTFNWTVDDNTVDKMWILVHEQCPHGFIYIEPFHTCYKFFSNIIRFGEAENSCRNLKAHLLSVRSDFERKFLDGNFSLLDGSN